jgi:hypothetical protein
MDSGTSFIFTKMNPIYLPPPQVFEHLLHESRFHLAGVAQFGEQGLSITTLGGSMFSYQNTMT